MDPFQIAVQDVVLDDLRDRLRRTRFPAVTPGDPWQLGTDADYLQALVRYWVDEFDWRKAELALNEFPQFTASVDGKQVHFVHVRAREARSQAIPLILGHGWPYSFIEMLEIVPYLVDPASTGGEETDVFDVVIPSLPGYGFSEAFDEEPFQSATVAGIWHQLMTDVLGYERYGTYGEDIGAPISDRIGELYPDHVIGLHASHMPMVTSNLPDDVTDDEMRFVEWFRSKWHGEGAYAAMQATKPNTLAVALNDSPAGLLAWIVEKLRSWSGGDESFTRAWTPDQILTLVTLYWVTGTTSSSFRPYADARPGSPRPLIDIPVGVSVQWGERGFPRSYAERTYRDIRFWNDLQEGGHFTAKQSPHLVAEDMRAFFRPLRGGVR